MKETSAGRPPLSSPGGNFVLQRMAIGKGKCRVDKMICLDQDLLAAAAEHGISTERRNLSDDINMAWMRSLKERGYIRDIARPAGPVRGPPLQRSS